MSYYIDSVVSKHIKVKSSKKTKQQLLTEK